MAVALIKLISASKTAAVLSTTTTYYRIDKKLNINKRLRTTAKYVSLYIYTYVCRLKNRSQQHFSMAYDNSYPFEAGAAEAI